MENILEITRFAFQGDAMQRLSSVLHESPGATKSGIEAAIPASLAGLAAHATSEQKAADLLGAFRGGDFPHADAGDVTKMVNDPVATARMAESGQGFLNRTFGGRLGGIVDALAGHTGVSRSSASTLLGLAAPLVLHAVSKEAESRNLDARGLSRFLADQGRRASGRIRPTIARSRSWTQASALRPSPAAPLSRRTNGADSARANSSAVGSAASPTVTQPLM